MQVRGSIGASEVLDLRSRSLGDITAKAWPLLSYAAQSCDLGLWCDQQAGCDHDRGSSKENKTSSGAR